MQTQQHRSLYHANPPPQISIPCKPNPTDLYTMQTQPHRYLCHANPPPQISMPCKTTTTDLRLLSVSPALWTSVCSSPLSACLWTSMCSSPLSACSVDLRVFFSPKRLSVAEAEGTLVRNVHVGGFSGLVWYYFCFSGSVSEGCLCVCVCVCLTALSILIQFLTP